MLQRAIKTAVSCKGIGLHTGASSFLEFRPATAGSGIFFTVPGGKKLSASVLNVTKTSRGTTLGPISTVEHVLAAVYGLGIDNIEIFIDGGEPPAMDGSAIDFVRLLNSSGTKYLQDEKKCFEVSVPITVKDGNSYIKATPLDRLFISAEINYDKTFIGKQSAIFDESSDDFERDISPARTFGIVSELEGLKRSGLAKGADSENAIGILENGFTSELRFPNELARHKILDIMGDMALAGKSIVGKIESFKAGHKLNVELVRRLING